MKDYEKHFGFIHPGFAVLYSCERTTKEFLCLVEKSSTTRWTGTITRDAKIIHTSGIPQNEFGSFCCLGCYHQSINCDLLNNLMDKDPARRQIQPTVEVWFDRDTTECESTFILILQINGKLIDTWKEHGVAWCETRDALVTPQRAWQYLWTRENHEVVRRCVIFFTSGVPISSRLKWVSFSRKRKTNVLHNKSVANGVSGDLSASLTRLYVTKWLTISQSIIWQKMTQYGKLYEIPTRNHFTGLFIQAPNSRSRPPSP